MNTRVCAIIVTWNSGKDIQRTLSAAANQVEKVVIVDNGSTPEYLAALQETAKAYQNAIIIENHENKGIGNALNRGAHYAIEHGFSWVATLDDNGKPEMNMFTGMLAAYEKLSPADRERTAIIAPNFTNLKGRVYQQDRPFFIPTTITSGQLVKTNVFQKVGFYKEDFFIACVDHEFCFRVLRAGYKTLLVPDCTLTATAGPAPVLRSMLGKKFVVPNYRPDRYYYTYRNSVYLYKTYWRYVPGWIIKNIISNAASFLKIIFFENQKLKKTVMIMRGVVDGLRNRLGRL